MRHASSISAEEQQLMLSQAAYPRPEDERGLELINIQINYAKDTY